MKQKKDVRQGTLALTVLRTLDVLGPRHDWEPTTAIVARFFEVKAGDLA